MPDLHYTDVDDQQFVRLLNGHYPLPRSGNAQPVPPEPPQADVDDEPDDEGDDGFSITMAAFPADGSECHSTITLPDPTSDTAIAAAAQRCMDAVLAQLGITTAPTSPTPGTGGR